ncbi:MAG: Hsp70 family protein [Paracoccaceae bacterium]
MPPVFAGIDFGTSNSTLGLATDADARLIPVEGGHNTIPSAIFWEEDTPAPVFGRAAIRAYVEGEEGRLIRALKSTLGSSLIDERTRIGARMISFRDLLGRFFRHLKAQLDAVHPGIDRVVLGRPVHFVDGDAAGDAAAQQALEVIARASGFAHVEFQYEPVAAALHYEQGLTAEETVLVFDIGGGTSDLSVLRLSPDRARAADRQGDILANDGIRAGGTDFDRLLSLAAVMPQLGYGATTRAGQGTMPRHLFHDLATWHRINMVYAARTRADLKALRAEADRPELIDRLIRIVDARAGHALAMRVEEAKIALTDAPAARLSLHDLTGGPNPMLTREALSDAIAPALDRIGTLLQAVLVQAGVGPEGIGTVFMTGGSSHLPALRAMVAARLPGARIATGDMLGSVGTGLALDARRRFA